MSTWIKVTPAVLVFVAACSTGAVEDISTTATPVSAVTTTVGVTTTSMSPTTLAGTTTTQWAGPPLYQYIGTASQDPDGDAMLCFGYYDLMAPPHCDGYPVLGLDWDEVPGANTFSETKWATVRLVGTFDGTVFAVTQPPEEPGVRHGEREPLTFDIPCPLPQGRWQTTNLATATGERQVQAKFYAEAQPDFAGMWISYPNPPSTLLQPGPDYVLVVGFTGRIEQHREQLESIYGGPLCVAQRERSITELNTLAEELFTLLGSAEAREHGIWVPPKGAVISRRIFTSPPLEAIVFAITSPDANSWVIEHFGEGAVSLWSVLTPLNPDA